MSNEIGNIRRTDQMKISFGHHILTLILLLIVIVASTSSVVLADQSIVKQVNTDASALNSAETIADTGIKVVNSDMPDTAVKTPAIIVAPDTASPKSSDIRITFVIGFFVLVLLTISLIFVFTFSY